MTERIFCHVVLLANFSPEQESPLDGSLNTVKTQCLGFDLDQIEQTGSRPNGFPSLKLNLGEQPIPKPEGLFQLETLTSDTEVLSPIFQSKSACDSETAVFGYYAPQSKSCSQFSCKVKLLPQQTPLKNPPGTPLEPSSMSISQICIGCAIHVCVKDFPLDLRFDL